MEAIAAELNRLGASAALAALGSPEEQPEGGFETHAYMAGGT
jgi:hypothetical protein